MVWAVSLSSDELSPAVLTADDKTYGIRSLLRVGSLAPPSPLQSSTPICELRDASPKAISRRTSYLRVRLAFHL